MLTTKQQNRLEEQLDHILVLLRNGSCIVGNGVVSSEFRQRCIQQAFYAACTELIPCMIEAGLVKRSDRLQNLIDINAMHQCNVIDRQQL